MDRITVIMSPREYKKFLACKEADKIVRDRVILLFIYDKSEMENIQTAYIEQIMRTVLNS